MLKTKTCTDNVLKGKTSELLRVGKVPLKQKFLCSVTEALTDNENF